MNNAPLYLKHSGHLTGCFEIPQVTKQRNERLARDSRGRRGTKSGVRGTNLRFDTRVSYQRACRLAGEAA